MAVQLNLLHGIHVHGRQYDPPARSLSNPHTLCPEQTHRHLPITLQSVSREGEPPERQFNYESCGWLEWKPGARRQGTSRHPSPIGNPVHLVEQCRPAISLLCDLDALGEKWLFGSAYIWGVLMLLTCPRYAPAPPGIRITFCKSPYRPLPTRRKPVSLRCPPFYTRKEHPLHNRKEHPLHKRMVCFMLHQLHPKTAGTPAKTVSSARKEHPHNNPRSHSQLGFQTCKTAGS